MKNWPRSRKLALAVPILLLSLLTISSISGLPSPFLETAIRRAERQQLVGPSEIIASMEFESSSWEHLIIGKTQQGYITYEYNDDPGWNDGKLNFYSQEKDGKLFCTEYWYRIGDEEWLPILLFPKNQRSANAKLSLSITVDDVTKSYSLSGSRQDSSFYLFSLPVEEMSGQHFWLLQQALTGAYSEYVLSGTVDIQIEFYDNQGKLTDTCTKTVTK